MSLSVLSVNVITCDGRGEIIEPLSVDNCPPQQLSSILSLCKKNYEVRISFVEIDPDGMRSETSD